MINPLCLCSVTGALDVRQAKFATLQVTYVLFFDVLREFANCFESSLFTGIYMCIYMTHK